MSGGAPVLALLAVLAVACAPANADDIGEAAPGVQAAPERVGPDQPTMPPPKPMPEPLRKTFDFAGELTQGGFIRGKAPTGTVTARLGERQLAVEEDGTFFAAFDRDAGTQDVLVATMADGSEVRADLAVSPRSWNIQHINAAKRPGGGSSESFRQRRAPELEAIWNARQAASESDGWSQDFIWPVTGRISGHFGRQRVYRGEPGSYHSGIDVAVPTGTPFVAPAAGVVTLASSRPFSLEGQIIIIDHGAGLNSAFIHLSDIAVEEGDIVEQGQLLGKVGATGRATGPHLHWSLKWQDTRLDPYLFVGPMP